MPYGIIRRTVFFESVFTQSSFSSQRVTTEFLVCRVRCSATRVTFAPRRRLHWQQKRRVLPCTLTLASSSSGACSPRRHHRGDHHTPPGRSPELASEKCACTTRQPPASLRNTMVERVMNSSPP